MRPNRYDRIPFRRLHGIAADSLLEELESAVAISDDERNRRATNQLDQHAAQRDAGSGRHHTSGNACGLIRTLAEGRHDRKQRQAHRTPR